MLLLVKDEQLNQNEFGPVAYGPWMVYALAQGDITKGSGAKQASTNADSYSWMVNGKPFSIYSHEIPGEH